MFKQDETSIFKGLKKQIFSIFIILFLPLKLNEVKIFLEKKLFAAINRQRNTSILQKKCFPYYFPGKKVCRQLFMGRMEGKFAFGQQGGRKNITTS